MQKLPPRACKQRGFRYPHRVHTGTSPALHRDHTVETRGAEGRTKAEGRMKNAEVKRRNPLHKCRDRIGLRDPG